MIKYKTKKIKQEVFDKFFCDKCGKEVTDDIELQEAYMIKFTAGYASVFGDMSEVTCDLCQRCLYDLIGDFCIVN